MTKTLLAAIGLACSIPASAQDIQATIPTKPEKTNEIGLFQNAVINTNVSDGFTMVGLQYKHWVRPNTAYRTLAAWTQYSSFDVRPSTKPAINDTAYSIFSNTTVGMAVIGAGVEMQRHFYKRVWLFAALELRGGTGNGGKEESLAGQYTEPNGNHYTTSVTSLGTKNVSMSYVGFVPSIGGKIQFNRISFGAELSPMEMSYRSIKTNGVGNGIMDFQLGTFANRFFINFRF